MQPLMAKYPFNPKGPVQATLADIDSIFEPKKGALWAFYDASLQKILQRQGNQFVPLSNSGMTVNPAFIIMMNRAAAFTAAAYADGAADPRFTYSVKPVMSPDEDSIKMNIDGQIRDVHTIEPGGEAVCLARSNQRHSSFGFL